MYPADVSALPALTVIRWRCPAGHSVHQQIETPVTYREISPAAWLKRERGCARCGADCCELYCLDCRREINRLRDSARRSKCCWCRRAKTPPCQRHGGMTRADRVKEKARRHDRKRRLRRSTRPGRWRPLSAAAITAAIQEHGGSVPKAADALGVTKQALYKRVELMKAQGLS